MRSLVLNTLCQPQGHLQIFAPTKKNVYLKNDATNRVQTLNLFASQNKSKIDRLTPEFVGNSLIF